MRSQIGNRESQIFIAGAGPAGSSLAIRLAATGHHVTLVEREKFPRHKLCGEFISPECLLHFGELGVLDEMLAAGGERIFETRFYDTAGRSFAVPSDLLDSGGFALSLSRSEMDRILLNRARSLGVEVLEGSKTSNAVVEADHIAGVTVSGDSSGKLIEADLFVDATGRSMALAKLIERKRSVRAPAKPSQPPAVGFKNHLRNISIPAGKCEIFAFPGGYGGLTTVENGLTNLCFLIDSKAVRQKGFGPEDMVTEGLFRNKIAARLLKNAEPVRDWLAVSVGSFGKTSVPETSNLLTVGDAAAFIDPFTGSGMLMAFESSALLAKTIGAGQSSPVFLRQRFHYEYDRLFSRRLRVCSLLRKASRLPMFPTLAVSFLNISRRSRNYLAGSTRSSGQPLPESVKTLGNP